MLREIETYCEDVIVLSQNYMSLTAQQFQDICQFQNLQNVVQDDAENINQK